LCFPPRPKMFSGPARLFFLRVWWLTRGSSGRPRSRAGAALVCAPGISKRTMWQELYNCRPRGHVHCAACWRSRRTRSQLNRRILEEELGNFLLQPIFEKVELRFPPAHDRPFIRIGHKHGNQNQIGIRTNRAGGSLGLVRPPRSTQSDRDLRTLIGPARGRSRRVAAPTPNR